MPEGDTLFRTAAGLRPWLIGRSVLAARAQGPGAVPRLDQEGERLAAIPGVPPNMARLPAGCPFSERCPFVQARCATERPPLVPVVDNPAALRACHAQAGFVVQQAARVQP